MDNLFEILIPLIFAAIYFFGNMLGGKSEEGEPSERPARRDREDPEAEQRQRRIQDEIRRKIQERREQGAGGRGGQADEGSSPAPQMRSASEADRSLRERRAAVEERRRQREQKRSAESAARKERDGSGSRAFGGGQPGNAYTNEMQERLKKIEATKRRAAQLQKQAKEVGAPASSDRERSSRDSGRLSGPVIDALRDPRAARVAFIYGEVLGPPVTERKAPNAPGLG